LDFVLKQVGCGLASEQAVCVTPFARTIHLVQHPIHVLQQLVPKLCPGNITTTKAVHPYFRQMAGVFVSDSDETLCVASLATHLVEYNRALLDARSSGHIDAMLQYESLTLCQLVRAAGFADADTAVYAPNVDKMHRLCGDSANDKASSSSTTVKTDAHQTMPQLETKTSDPTMQLATLSWHDLEAVGGTALVKALKDLCAELGYDPNAPFIAVNETK
jgi:hypothetical protein